VTSLADQIANDPVLLPLLDPLKTQGQQLRAAQAAADQHCDHRVIPQLAHGRRRLGVEKPPPLLWGEPISEAHADSPHPLQSTDTRREFGTQESGVAGLVGDAPEGG
jgi:hypothetical protein